MKTIELKDRKYTTDGAKSAVIEFIESFDFSSYTDLGYIQSKFFNVTFDVTGNDLLHDSAFFMLDEGKFLLSTYSEEVGNTREYNKNWKDISAVFDGTCTFIDFKGLISAMEDFIARINDRVEKKEAEIAEFLAFVEAWKNADHPVQES